MPAPARSAPLPGPAARSTRGASHRHLVARQGVPHHSAHDERAVEPEADGLRVVRHECPRVRGGPDEPESEPLAARHLRVVPESTSRQVVPRQARDEKERLRPRQHAAPWDPLLFREPLVPIGAQQVVQGQARAQDGAALLPEAPRGHEESQRPDERRSDAKERPPLAHGLAQAREVSVRQVPEPAVDRLEAVPGHAGPEVVALHEGDAEAALRRVPGRGRAVDAAPDHEEVVLARGEGREVALHGTSDDSIPPVRAVKRARPPGRVATRERSCPPGGGPRTGTDARCASRRSTGGLPASWRRR